MMLQAWQEALILQPQEHQKSLQQEAEYQHQVVQHQLAAQQELLSLAAQEGLVVQYDPNEQGQMDEKTV